MKSLGQDVSEKELADTIRQVDFDGDMKLDMQEFLVSLWTPFTDWECWVFAHTYHLLP